ncbi:MAG TPA: hypothetical protein DIW47_00990 [Bacteroidetes bacterium]|nr:hypothetical protein [Bacteroidota bacterium]
MAGIPAFPFVHSNESPEARMQIDWDFRNKWGFDTSNKWNLWVDSILPMKGLIHTKRNLPHPACLPLQKKLWHPDYRRSDFVEMI